MSAIFETSPLRQLYSNVVRSSEMLRTASAIAGMVAVEGYTLDEAVEETREDKLLGFVCPVGWVAPELVEAERQVHALRVETAIDMAKAAIASSGASTACSALLAAAQGADAHEEEVRRLVDREQNASAPDNT